MYVAIDTGHRTNEDNLAERTWTTAEMWGNTGHQCSIHWPAGQDTWLSILPDGTWSTSPGVNGPYEIFNIIPMGNELVEFEANPEWNTDHRLGSKSVIISGRILKEK